MTAQISYRLCNLLSAHAFPPEAVNIYPTDRCNLKCLMCFERLRKPRVELDIVDWINVIEQIKRFRPRIHISGGEPFVYSKIMDLVSHIRKNDLFLTITTNGTFLSEYAKDIMRLKVNRIHISIDGSEDVHDTIRGVKGTFNRIMKGLEKIRKLAKYARLPLIRINSMINFAQPTVMSEVIDIACHIDAHSIQFLHPMFANTQDIKSHRIFLKNYLHLNLNYWQNADISYKKPEDFKEAYNVVNNLKKERGILIDVFPSFNLKQLKAYYTGDENFYSIMHGACRAMWNTATIVPSGEVESCPDPAGQTERSIT